VPPNKSIYLSISGANSEFFDGENRVGKMKNVHLWMEKFHFANSKRKTFFYWNLKRKISNFKIQRGPRSPLPMSMISSSCSTQISNSFPLVFQLSNTLIFRNRAWNRNFMIAVRKKEPHFLLRVVSSQTFLGASFATISTALISAGKWFIPRRALICFARSVPLGRSLNTAAFAGNSFYSIRALQLYITVLKP